MKIEDITNEEEARQALAEIVNRDGYLIIGTDADQRPGDIVSVPIQFLQFLIYQPFSIIRKATRAEARRQCPSGAVVTPYKHHYAVSMD